MSDEQPTTSPAEPPSPGGADARRAEAMQTCPPFRPAVLRRQIALDSAFRWMLLILLLVFILVGISVGEAGSGGVGNAGGEVPGSDATGGGGSGLVLLIVLGAAWVWMTLSGAKAAQRLGVITALLDIDPARAESLIAQTQHRWPLPRPIRLLLYHRLAVLRHRQQQFAEAALICRTLLGYKLGSADPRPGRMVAATPTLRLGEASGSSTAPTSSSPAATGAVRSHLLLMLTECQLAANDLAGAYQALMELHRGRLGLIESLQRMALQLRYEVAAGHDAAALHHLDSKLRLAELMPAPACGALHLLLIAPAQRLGRTTLADWLHHRAELLCTPEQLAAQG
ncbi:MAG: hypothetical protein WD042_13400 [Phycisphaeraceae bacterium]